MTDQIIQRVAMDALVGRVGDLVTSLWDYSLGLVVNLILLPRNAEDLTQEMQKLEELRDDLRNRAQHEARQTQTEVTQQLSGWIKRVESLSSEVTKFQDSFERQSICITGFCLGHNAAELLRRVKRLTEERNAWPQSELVFQRGPDAVEQIRFDTSSSSMVGAEEILRRIQDHIMDDGVGIIGIYGIGGVGKTTLLKIINNEFLQRKARGKFEVAIWVTVSKDVNILGIQNAVGDRLGLSSNTPANILFRELSKKRFILLLDDVWKKLDFMRIGIPLPKNVKINCKILFTTRSEQVCNEMDADQMVNVSLLDDKSSWELFWSKVGRAAVLNDSGLQQLAKEVVARCGGLPISLITVGKAMANATTPNDWQDAIVKLDQCAVEVSGMDQVLASLKCSFDMLKDETLRSCLLYCALFPEDYNIPKGEIIAYWGGEGFLDSKYYDEYDIDRTRNRGHALIRELQNASLLEGGNTGDGEASVKLHDTVRDMALWITSQDFVALAGNSWTRVPHLRIWESAKRISLMKNGTTEEPPSWKLRCPNLTTLLLNSSTVGRQVPGGFFADMHALRVLDLTGTSLTEFPIEITLLDQLQHLNLTATNLTSLPKELGNLTNLRQLILGFTRHLRSIPREAISPLSRLQVLDLWSSGYAFGREAGRHLQLELSDLGNLRRLRDLSLRVGSWPSLDMLVASCVLRRCVRSLEIELDYGGCPSAAIMSKKIGELSELRRLGLRDNPKNPVEGELGLRPDNLRNLEILRIYSFTKAGISVLDQSCTSQMGGLLFPRLQELVIDDCHGFSELTWAGQLPCLETLDVRRCDGVTQVVLLDGGDAPAARYGNSTSSFSKLKRMELQHLPSLRSISLRPLLFPSLESLIVWNCPQLKQLPFGPESAKKIQKIYGDPKWWDGLEWDTCADGGSVKSNFIDHFRPGKPMFRLFPTINFETISTVLRL